jgi:hypothetical protein
MDSAYPPKFDVMCGSRISLKFRFSHNFCRSQYDSSGTIGEIWIILIGFHGLLNGFGLIEEFFLLVK